MRELVFSVDQWGQVIDELLRRDRQDDAAELRNYAEYNSYRQLFTYAQDRHDHARRERSRRPILDSRGHIIEKAVTKSSTTESQQTLLLLI